MTVFVLLRDHTSGEVEPIVIEPAEQVTVATQWEWEDPLLLSLQNQPLFKDCFSWADADLTHYHALLALHLSVMAENGWKVGIDTQATVVRSVRMILAALIYELESRMEGNISQLTVHRISDSVVEIDLAATLCSMELPKPSVGLKVVVDNS